MKKFFLSFILAFIVNAYLSAQTGAALDNANTTSMMPIVSGIEETIKTVEKENVEIVRMEFDLIFEGKPKETLRTLVQGYTYGVLVWGDYKIKQMAVNVYKKVNGSWQFVITGTPSGSTTTAYVKIEETGEYKFEYHVIQLAEGFTGGHYGMLLIHD